MNAICPRCKARNAVPPSIASRSQPIACSKCKVKFTFELVRIRAKRSRGFNDLASHREFQVRVIDGKGQERLIKFVNAAYGDFELRAKDQ